MRRTGQTWVNLIVSFLESLLHQLFFGAALFMLSDNGLASEVYIVKVHPTNVQSEAATTAPRVAVAFF